MKKSNVALIIILLASVIVLSSYYINTSPQTTTIEGGNYYNVMVRNQSLIFTVYFDQKIHSIDLLTNKENHIFDDAIQVTNGAVLDFRNGTLAMTRLSDSFEVYAANGTKLMTAEWYGNTINTLVVSQTGKFILAATYGRIAIYRTSDGAKLLDQHPLYAINQYNICEQCGLKEVRSLYGEDGFAILTDIGVGGLITENTTSHEMKSMELPKADISWLTCDDGIYIGSGRHVYYYEGNDMAKSVDVMNNYHHEQFDVYKDQIVVYTNTSVRMQGKSLTDTYYPRLLTAQDVQMRQFEKYIAAANGNIYFLANEKILVVQISTIDRDPIIDRLWIWIIVFLSLLILVTLNLASMMKTRHEKSVFHLNDISTNTIIAVKYGILVYIMLYHNATGFVLALSGYFMIELVNILRSGMLTTKQSEGLSTKLSQIAKIDPAFSDISKVANTFQHFIVIVLQLVAVYFTFDNSIYVQDHFSTGAAIMLGIIVYILVLAITYGSMYLLDSIKLTNLWQKTSKMYDSPEQFDKSLKFGTVDRNVYLKGIDGGFKNIFELHAALKLGIQDRTTLMKFFSGFKNFLKPGQDTGEVQRSDKLGFENLEQFKIAKEMGYENADEYQFANSPVRKRKIMSREDLQRYFSERGLVMSKIMDPNYGGWHSLAQFEKDYRKGFITFYEAEMARQYGCDDINSFSTHLSKRGYSISAVRNESSYKDILNHA